jgi:hypothetical protein
MKNVNVTNGAEAPLNFLPNVQALAPSMAHSEPENSDKNSEAIDGCQQRSCSARAMDKEGGV